MNPFPTIVSDEGEVFVFEAPLLRALMLSDQVTLHRKRPISI
jgi:hypothetical protein